MSRLVVKKHRPLEILLFCLLFSISISVLVWLLLDATHWGVIKSRFLKGREASMLWQENRKLKYENQALGEKIIMLQRLAHVDNETAASLQNEIRNLQDTVYELKGELEFYQGIMVSTTGSNGLNIQGLRIDTTEQRNVYRYKLILTNVAKSDRVINVIMDMLFEGFQDSNTKILSLHQVATGDLFSKEISFKNFERIEGSVTFPDGFVPMRVIVDLRQKGVSKTTVQRVFEWSATAG